MKPISMRCTQEQWVAIKPKVEHLKWHGIRFHYGDTYLVNNLAGKIPNISSIDAYSKSSYKRKVFETWDEDTFLEYCDIKTTKTTTMKTRITAAELLELHSIACSKWKGYFAKAFTRLSAEQTLEFDLTEIGDMFKAAADVQKPVLEKIFGKQQKPIDFSKIKTGSVVMIQSTGKECRGIGVIDAEKPVEVVLYKSDYFIGSSSDFRLNNQNMKYTTFYQNGTYIHFVHDENAITSVISY